MANKFQIKRTTTSGRTPNTTNSGNSYYIDTGELAINLTDGRLFSSNGSALLEFATIGTPIYDENGNLITNTYIQVASLAAVNTDIIPISNNTFNIGNNTNRFANLYLSGNTIILGDTIITSNSTQISFKNANGTSFGVTGNVDTSSITSGTLGTARGGTGLSSFTSGGVVYASNTSTLATGSALTFDGSEVGFTRASSAFYRATESGSSIASYFGSYSGVNYIGTTSNHPVAFYQNGSEQMRLTSTGLGIGTSSPQKKLVVSNAGAVGMEWSPTDYSGNMRQLAYNRNTSAYVALRTEASQHEWYIGGSESMRLDSSGNLGIGTSSPSNKLDVTGAGAGYWNGSTGWTGGTPTAIVVTNSRNGGYDPVIIGRMSDSGGTSQDALAIGMVGTAAWTAGNNGSQIADMYIATRNSSGGISERIRIKSTGTVGIGTSGPESTLHIAQSSSGGLGAQLILDNPAGSVLDNAVEISFLTDGGASGTGTRNARIRAVNNNAGDGSAHLQFWTWNGAADAERARITSGGDLLVGTTGAYASSKLCVTGSGAFNTGGVDGTFTSFINAVYTGNTAQFGSIQHSMSSISTFSGFRFLGGGAGGSGTTQEKLLDLTRGQTIFYTGDTERARITSGGDFVVGDTSALNTNARVSVWNTAGAAKGIATGYSTSNGQFRLIYLTSSNDALNFDNGTNNATLTSAGAWTNASDARIKKNITDIKYGLADVLKTKPRSYEMKEVAGEYIGFIAQELLEVVPEVVSGDPEEQLGVDYGSLVALAFKAIQEQQVMINELKAKVAALESK